MCLSIWKPPEAVGSDLFLSGSSPRVVLALEHGQKWEEEVKSVTETLHWRHWESYNIRNKGNICQYGITKKTILLRVHGYNRPVSTRRHCFYFSSFFHSGSYRLSAPPHLLQHLLSLEGRDCALQLLCGEGHPLLSARWPLVVLWGSLHLL